MLEKLTIENVALIERTEIEFTKGLNVLSGETGAGKSVILDSVNFVLGAKADKSMIRYGENECFVRAEFSVQEGAPTLGVLREMEIESDGEILISRRFSLDGKNSIKVNGCTVTSAMLKKITSGLVDVHGQSEHFFLLSESNQLKMLDEVCGEKLSELKTELKGLTEQRKAIDEKISSLGGDEKERARRLEILDFECKEITSANLQIGEEKELTAKKNKIDSLEKIITSIREASEALSGENACLDALYEAKRSVGAIKKFDEEYERIYDRLENLSAEIDDVSETLGGFLDGLEFDENEAVRIDERLDLIRSLKRKYGQDITEILAFLEKANAERELLSDAAGQYDKLVLERKKVLRSIFDTAKKMTELRKKTATEFCTRVENELKTLNIPAAKLEVNFAHYTLEDAEKASQNGLDEICFLFSANAGEPVKPLGKIISGGEMSRFMLAIKTQLSGLNGISTYIFDEIDAGISGNTAKVVGQKFAKIAKSTQIIAVSHLAQIVAMSDGDFLIEKHEENGSTKTNVYPLDKEGKKQEIVRLLGGTNEQEYALKHAEELIKEAEEYKKAL